MRRSILPAAVSSKIFFLCAGVLNRESTSMRTGKERKRFTAVA